MDVLSDLKEALLLVLDEAQRLWHLAQTKDHRADDASNLLNAIHNGEFERPVILAAAGLGTTRQVFRDIEISRFEGALSSDWGGSAKHTRGISSATGSSKKPEQREIHTLD